MTQTIPADLPSLLRYIKRSLHGMMNGVASASMRQKGLQYKVNFGVELPRLQAWAAELPHTYELAAALWKEDIRECRLLAAMLMPVERFDTELAQVWVEQMRFAEEAECTAMHLLCRVPGISQKAFEWIASAEAIPQVCGYMVLARLFMQGAAPSERDGAEFLDQAAAALTPAADALVARAAGKAVMKYMQISTACEAAAEQMLQALPASPAPAAPQPEAL